MQFLKTLFWVLIAVVVAVMATANWNDVTLKLWGNLEADIKLPLLLLVVALLGFLPPFLLLRSRLWRVKRKLLLAEHELASAHHAPASTPSHPAPAQRAADLEEEDLF